MTKIRPVATIVSVGLFMLAQVSCADRGDEPRAGSSGGSIGREVAPPPEILTAASDSIQPYIAKGDPSVDVAFAAAADELAKANPDAALLAQEEGAPHEEVYAIFFQGAVFQQSDGTSASAPYDHGRVIITEAGTVLETRFWNAKLSFDPRAEPFAPALRTVPDSGDVTGP